MIANISKPLKAYMDIRETYFKESKLLPLNTIKDQIFDKYSDLPFIDLAMIINMVEEDHRRALLAIQQNTQVGIFEKRFQCLSESYPYLQSFQPAYKNKKTETA